MKTLRIEVKIFNESIIYWVNSHHMDWYDKKILLNKFADIREYFSKNYSY